MATVLRLNINELSNQLLYELGQKFGQSAEVEIRVQKKKKKQELFSDKQFWQIINMLDWTQKKPKRYFSSGHKTTCRNAHCQHLFIRG